MNPFDPPLLEGRLIARYKRFLADVELPHGQVVTSHCPNTGAMTGCQTPGSRVWLQPSRNPQRKLSSTWELVQTEDGSLACIHSARANKVMEKALLDGSIPGLTGFGKLRREVRYGKENSRADFMLEFGGDACFVEVKSVTLAADAIGLFPDAVSTRGTRHLRELMEVKRQGARAVLCFVVMHNGVDEVRPADQVDPTYGTTLRLAYASGIEVIACRAQVSVTQIQVAGMLPVVLPDL